MRENIDIIGVFHDGSITKVTGSIPEIELQLEIPYLRNMFPGKGDSFFANITGCTFIEFLNWETEKRTSDLAEIEKEEPEILSVEQNGEVAHIICSTGELDISYTDISFRLDAGQELSYQNLGDACNKYWDDWESRNKNS